MHIHYKSLLTRVYDHAHRRSQGGKGAMPPPKFLEDIAILCFERRFFKQNSVIRLKSNICPQNFWAGYATDHAGCNVYCKDFTVALKMFDVFRRNKYATM